MHRFMLFFAALCGAIGLSAAAAAQTTLTSPGVDNNGNSAHAFDLTAINAVTLIEVTSSADGAGTFEVYGRTGTHVGNLGSSAGWTLLGSAVAGGSGPITVAVAPTAIPAGDTYAIAVLTSNSLDYDNGAGAVGDVIASDANLQMRSGTGFTGFTGGGEFTPRDLVGSVTYTSGIVTPAVVPTLTEWAMILLAMGLGGVALVYARRRGLV